MTQEQAEEFMKRIQSGEGPSRADRASGRGSGGTPPEGEQRRAPPTPPQDFHLREGLTVTVSIIVNERKDALLVPNSAITTRESTTSVQVLSADGTVEGREIETGISDFQYTEVTGGLSEGEEVVTSQRSPSSESSTGSGRIRIPFFGGGGR
jgi:multidrug efflux pump subunit AcrA (membrane-fusion protein)